MRKWGIVTWMLVGLFAATTGLFDTRFQLIVDTLRRDSSLKNLNWLYRQLKEDRRHGHRNTK